MPEWLRLLRGLSRQGSKAIPSVSREIAPVIGHTIPYQPRLIEPLSNTYFVESAPSFLTSSTKRAYSPPVVNRIEHPSGEVVRTIYRGSIGLPDGYVSGNPLSLEQSRRILQQSPTSINPYLLNARLNVSDPSFINYRDLIHDAGTQLYNYREVNPYASVQEFMEEVPLFERSGVSLPWNQGVWGTQRALEGGYDISSPALDDYRTRAIEEAINFGSVNPENPYVQQELQREIEQGTRWSKNLESLIDTYYKNVTSTWSSSTARDASSGALRKLSPYAARYLTTDEKVELLKKALPDGITVEDLTPEQIKAFKKMVREDSGLGAAHALIRRYDRGFLSRMDDLKSFYPDEKAQEILDIINSAYRGTKPIGGFTPWQELLAKRYSEEIGRRFGLNLTPDELNVLYNVADPRYPEIAAKARAYGASVLPGDIQHMGWFQVRNANDVTNSWTPDLPDDVFGNWTPEQKEMFVDRARALLKSTLTSQAQIKTGIQAKMLRKALPRQTGIFEFNTSPDSYLLETKTTATSPEYGIGEGKIKLVEVPINGDMTREFGNTLQLNRLRYGPDGTISSDLNVPGVAQNAFTRDEAEQLLDLLNFTGTRPEAIKQLFVVSPQWKDVLTRMINVLRATNERDVNPSTLALGKINAKHRAWGIPEIAPPSVTPIALPDEPTFYDSDNLDRLFDLLQQLHREAKASVSIDSGSGFAMPMTRTPVGALKQRWGGRIPNWVKKQIKY